MSNSEDINNNYIKDNLIYYSNCDNKCNLLFYSDLSKGLYLHQPKLINFVKINNESLIYNIKKDSLRAYLHSCGISFKLKSNVNPNTKCKFKFRGKLNTKHDNNNIFFKIHTGIKWIIIEKKVTNNYQEFEIIDDFKFNNFKEQNNDEVSFYNGEKYRIGFYDNYLKKNNILKNETEYEFEITNLEIIDISNENENNDIKYNSNDEIHFRFYTPIPINIKSYIFSYFLEFDDYFFSKKIKVSLFNLNNLNDDYNNKYEENNILILTDWYTIYNYKSDRKNKYKELMNKFLKKNIIWFNFECPWIDLKCLKENIMKDYNLTMTTYCGAYPGFKRLCLESNYKNDNLKEIINDSTGNPNLSNLNVFWKPLPSPPLDYYNYTKCKFIENELDKKEHFCLANPSKYGGHMNDYSYNKFGKRADIIDKLVDEGLEIHFFNLIHFYRNRKLIRDTLDDLGTTGNGKKYYRGEKLCYKQNQYYNSISKKHLYKIYKFVIIAENYFTDGYITEKLVDCLYSLNVPVYFGFPNVEIALPKLFDNGVINGFNFDSLKDLVKFLNEMSDEEYNKRIEVIKRERHTLFKIHSENNQMSFTLTTFLRKKGYDINYNNFNIDLLNINKLLDSDNNKFNLKKN